MMDKLAPFLYLGLVGLVPYYGTSRTLLWYRLYLTVVRVVPNDEIIRYTQGDGYQSSTLLFEKAFPVYLAPAK